MNVGFYSRKVKGAGSVDTEIFIFAGIFTIGLASIGIFITSGCAGSWIYGFEGVFTVGLAWNRGYVSEGG